MKTKWRKLPWHPLLRLRNLRCFIHFWMSDKSKHSIKSLTLLILYFIVYNPYQCILSIVFQPDLKALTACRVQTAPLLAGDLTEPPENKLGPQKSCSGYIFAIVDYRRKQMSEKVDGFSLVVWKMLLEWPDGYSSTWYRSAAQTFTSNMHLQLSLHFFYFRKKRPDRRSLAASRVCGLTRGDVL